MSETADLLARLADIHEPPAPEPSVPWLILLNLALALAWVALLAWRWWRRREAWRREALSIIDATRGRPSDEALTSLATLLAPRRAAPARRTRRPDSTERRGSRRSTSASPRIGSAPARDEPSVSALYAPRCAPPGRHRRACDAASGGLVRRLPSAPGPPRVPADAAPRTTRHRRG